MRKELMLERAGLDNPDTIAAKDEIADALIDTVKAKLSLLTD